MNFIDLLNEFHIMPQFPPSVMKLSGDLPSEVSDEDLKGRTDLTDKLIITIDGDDAKDFDDAISLQLLFGRSYSGCNPLCKGKFAHRPRRVYAWDKRVPY